MTDHCNKTECEVEFGKASVIKRGEKGLVVCAAETLDIVVEAAKELDVTILYYTTMSPFDENALKQEIKCGKVFVCTPFYEGTLTPCITKALKGERISIVEQSVPLEILRNYGSKLEKDEFCGLSVSNIRKRMTTFFN